MVADGMAFRRKPSDEFRVPLRASTDHEESCRRAMGGENVEETRRVNWIRPVVECQRDHWILCQNMRYCFSNFDTI
jgi:hypothetical protein